MTIRAFNLYADPSDPLYIQQFDLYSTIALGFFAAMDVFTVLGFIFYAVRLSSYMKRFPLGTPTSKLLFVSRIKLYVVVCAVCFFVRAGYTLFEIVQLNSQVQVSATAQKILVQMLVVLPEWLALLVMLLWMRFRSRKHKPLLSADSVTEDYGGGDVFVTINQHDGVFQQYQPKYM
eukprot:TRINITY_DN2761_c0_g1_i1.p1 TRINITY_DN2761_c0_g1~~TRINITY_DN2761_c0_g1_i1.p1  ORF type:complete len:176 (+),score=45.12 TRINITY_DN2761_c0_g1_i1:296-823(+)